MKYIEKYKSMGILSDNSSFEYLLSHLKDTIRTYDFFVAWGKVLGNVFQIEVALNILNSLIGKDDIKNRFKQLINQYPEVVPVIPFLIAVRGTTIKIADLGGDTTYSFSKKKTYSDEQVESIVLFAEKSGLLQVLEDKSIKNLVDYAIGVEVGLDTNARKNRSGTAMENLTEVYVKDICEKHGFKYLSQATAAKIKQEFGKDVSTDKADRHFDFAIDTGDMLYLMEVNYYGGGGSKLKSVAGEFSSLFGLVKNENTGFIWVTDGDGWQEGDLVLDQFAGGGTTLVEAKLLSRNSIGVDVNDIALERCKEKIDFEHEGAYGKVYLHKGDARNLDFIPDESIDFVCTHPPYANIIEYSEDIKEDLSHLKIKDFLEEMKKVASESYRVLKKDKFCAILMGDTRIKGHVQPMSFEVMKIFESQGFKLKEIIIKEQHNCRATGYWKTNSVKYNFLLLAHEYLFVFRK